MIYFNPSMTLHESTRPQADIAPIPGGIFLLRTLFISRLLIERMYTIDAISTESKAAAGELDELMKQPAFARIQQEYTRLASRSGRDDPELYARVARIESLRERASLFSDASSFIRTESPKLLVEIVGRVPEGCYQIGQNIYNKTQMAEHPGTIVRLDPGPEVVDFAVFSHVGPVAMPVRRASMLDVAMLFEDVRFEQQTYHDIL